MRLFSIPFYNNSLLFLLPSPPLPPHTHTHAHRVLRKTTSRVLCFNTNCESVRSFIFFFWSPCVFDIYWNVSLFFLLLGFFFLFLYPFRRNFFKLALTVNSDFPVFFFLHLLLLLLLFVLFFFICILSPFLLIACNPIIIITCVFVLFLPFPFFFSIWNVRFSFLFSGV